VTAQQIDEIGEGTLNWHFDF